MKKTHDFDWIYAFLFASVFMLFKEIFCFFGICRTDRYLNKETFNPWELAVYTILTSYLVLRIVAKRRKN
jgi:hypothetical protein